jgi:hypothetical protein
VVATIFEADTAEWRDEMNRRQSAIAIIDTDQTLCKTRPSDPMQNVSVPSIFPKSILFMMNQRG